MTAIHAVDHNLLCLCLVGCWDACVLSAGLGRLCLVGWAGTLVSCRLGWDESSLLKHINRGDSGETPQFCKCTPGNHNLCMYTYSNIKSYELLVTSRVHKHCLCTLGNMYQQLTMASLGSVSWIPPPPYTVQRSLHPPRIHDVVCSGSCILQ